MTVPAIAMRNIRKSFGAGETRVEVLKQIGLEIGSGETVALLGKSGSGKSTLLSLFAGLDRPDEGEIFIEGRNIATMPEKELTKFRAQRIGIVFQQFHLVSTLSALENVLLPLEILKIPDAEKQAKDLLELVGLTHRLEHLPSEMSGGECQRVAIARALAISPSLLFADEPSGNLDEETGALVMDLLFKMVERSKTTLILITHDRELAERCGRIVHLEHGRLV